MKDQKQNNVSVAILVTLGVMATAWLGSIVLCGIGAKPKGEIESKPAYNNTLQENTNKPIINASAVELIDAFGENEVKAARSFKGKRVRVSGVVERIKDGMIVLDGKGNRVNMFYDLRITGIPNHNLVNLSVGDEIAVTCNRVTPARFGGGVEVSNCE